MSLTFSYKATYSFPQLIIKTVFKNVFVYKHNTGFFNKCKFVLLTSGRIA